MENNEIRSNEIVLNDDKRGLGLAISSLVISIIGIIPTVFSAIASIQSLILSSKDNADLGDGIGAALLIIFLLPAVLVAFVLSAVSLGLGIGSLSKAKSKKVKAIGISGTVISAICIVVFVLSVVLRLTIQG